MSESEPTFQSTQKPKYYVPDVKCSNFQRSGDILPQYFWYQSSLRTQAFTWDPK